jgi:hypothetical protein
MQSTTTVQNRWFVCIVLNFFLAPAIGAAENQTIQDAIKRGVSYLQQVHKPGKGYVGGSHRIGTACLAGLALLETGVPLNDPALANIITFVRDNALSQGRTYEIALTIMFLDRLGDSADEAVVQFLGVRLMAGQLQSGGWNYDSGYLQLTPEEQKRLRESRRPDSKSNERPVLHPEIARLAKRISTKNPNPDEAVFAADNSNTQFAALGLWCARRHGVPCDRALEFIGMRFRETQLQDGGWQYDIRRVSTSSMTCSGLIGLAVAHGSARVGGKKPNPKGPKKTAPTGVLEDRSVLAGLQFLAASIAVAKAVKQNPKNETPLESDLYFLWSLERVSVIYGLETVGKHDWYAWGADALVASQLKNGAWNSTGPTKGEDVGTCLAILFLHRANVAKDLSAILQTKDKESTLKGGKPDPKKPAPKKEP